MNQIILERLIKESLKDMAIRIEELPILERNSLVAEYREWIVKDINYEAIQMLPYEAYTLRIENKNMDDLI